MGDLASPITKIFTLGSLFQEYEEEFHIHMILQMRGLWISGGNREKMHKGLESRIRNQFVDY